MADGWLAIGWLSVLVVGVAACVGLRRAGVPMTYVRDVLHVGAGLWPLGWGSWGGGAAPCAIAASGALALVAVPALAARSSVARGVRDAVSGEDERFAGVALYAVAAAAFTAVAMAWRTAAPAAAGALLALALGDGLGGAVGRRFGRRALRVPFGKPKSWEGAVAVTAFSALGAWIALRWYGAPATPLAIAGAGVVAGLAEALAPRATDNLLVPAAVFAWLRLASGVPGLA
jgi:dolichol kinase